MHIECGIERRGARITFQCWVCACLEQQLGQVEMSINCRHQYRARPVRRAWLVDIGTTLEQCLHCINVTFAGRKEKRRQPTVCPDEVGIAKWFRLFLQVYFAWRCLTLSRHLRRCCLGPPGPFDAHQLVAQRVDPFAPGPQVGEVDLVACGYVNDCSGYPGVGAGLEQRLDHGHSITCRGEH